MNAAANRMAQRKQSCQREAHALALQCQSVGEALCRGELTTAELEVSLGELKSGGPHYFDLSPGDRALFDALVRLRAERRSQLPVEQRYQVDP